MHRPETWGYVQFATGKIGEAKFHGDAAGWAKHLLHEIYYAQRDYRAKHQRYAKKLEELGFGDISDSSLVRQPRLQTTRSGFEASVTVRDQDKQQRWFIRQDALLGKD